MNAVAFRRWLQPSETLRWHPWAPLVAAGLAAAFVFAFGAAWGFAAAKRMAHEQAINVEPWTYTRTQVEAMRPARAAIEAARAFDIAVIHGAREAEAGRSRLHRWRLALEQAVFGEAWQDRRNPDRPVELNALFRDNARRAAEYRLANLAGAAPFWKRTATLCEEMAGNMDLSAQLARTAAAYTSVLGRPVTPEQLAPLSGARCG